MLGGQHVACWPDVAVGLENEPQSNENQRYLYDHVELVQVFGQQRRSVIGMSQLISEKFKRKLKLKT